MEKLESKESRKSGRNKEPCQLNGRSDESSKDSGIFPIMDEVLAKEAFEEIKVEGKSSEELLRELESLKEVITNDLFMRALV